MSLLDTERTVARLRLLQLSSASFPIGAFSYSQGLEQAVDAGFVRGETEALDWICGQLSEGLSRLELPLLLRFHDAFMSEDVARARALAELELSFRDARELREESEKLGRACVRMLLALGASQASVIDFPLGYVGAFALGAASFAVSKTDAAEGFAYAWCENQTVAASRLVPLGQTAAQRVLSACLAEVPGALRHAEDCELRNLGRSVPGHGLVCMAHESQYSRLFLS